jgi:two-component system sensor histidine kinase DegS
MVLRGDQDEDSDQRAVYKSEFGEELAKSQHELEEISLMLEQSRLEVNKLAQRNASINARLQQVQDQFDSLPRDDIRDAYDAALDAQQRLFVMRGQIEKLQSDETYLQRYIGVLEKALAMFEEAGTENSRPKGGKAPVETLEMMIQAQEAERQRLSRQMHDGPAQALSNFILQTEIAMRLFDMDQAKARDELENLKVNSTAAFQQVRDFIFDLRPMMLDDLGLVPTLKRYIEAFKEKSGIDLRLGVTGTERRFESYLEVLIFRAVQDLLGDALHNRQASQIKAQLDIDQSNVKVEIEDNGRGLDIDALEAEEGMILKLIKDRVEMLGGYFDAHSMDGQGAKVAFLVPTAKVSS